MVKVENWHDGQIILAKNPGETRIISVVPLQLLFLKILKFFRVLLYFFLFFWGNQINKQTETKSKKKRKTEIPKQKLLVFSFKIGTLENPKS